MYSMLEVVVWVVFWFVGDGGVGNDEVILG